MHGSSFPPTRLQRAHCRDLRFLRQDHARACEPYSPAPPAHCCSRRTSAPAALSTAAKPAGLLSNPPLLLGPLLLPISPSGSRQVRPRTLLLSSLAVPSFTLAAPRAATSRTLPHGQERRGQLRRSAAVPVGRYTRRGRTPAPPLPVAPSHARPASPWR